MSSIYDLLAQIKNAVYGKDVRDAIHDSIEQCYDDATGTPESIAGAVADIQSYKEQTDALISNYESQFNTMMADYEDRIDAQVDNLVANVKPNTVVNLWRGVTGVEPSGKYQDVIPLSDDISNYDYIDIYAQSSYNTPVRVRVDKSSGRTLAKVTNIESAGYAHPDNNFFILNETHIVFEDNGNEGLVTYTWSVHDTNGTQTYDWNNAEIAPLHIERIDGIKVGADASAEVADIRVGEDGTVYQTAGAAVRGQIADVKQDLQDIIDHGTGGGMSAEFKQALHDIFEKVAYIDGNGQDYLDALDDAMSSVTAISLNTNTLSFSALNTTQQLTATTTPSGGAVSWSSSNTSVATVSSSGVVTSVGYGTATITASSGSVSASCSVVVAQATLVSISCVYTQSGTVYESTSLDSLKSDLVVTATWDNSTTSTVASTDYELSGTLTEGTSTITVTYGGKTTTFNVTVSSTVQYVKVGNPTITDNIMTPSYGNFIRTNIPFSPNGQSWEIRTKLRVVTLPTDWRSVIGSVDSDGVYVKICHIQINSNKQLTMYGSSDGVNWDALSNFYTDNNALNETGIWYYIKFEFTGTAYKITIYKDGWDGTVWKTKSTNSSISIMDGQYYGFGLSRDSSIVNMNAEYDLSETKIYIGGNLAWSAIAE